MALILKNSLMGVLHLGRLLKKTSERWIHDQAFRLSAALAYYAVFSMAPLLIIIAVLVGMVYSGDTIEQVRTRFEEFISPQAADLIAKGIVNAASTVEGGIGYTAFAVILMLIGASAFTYQLQSAVEAMWNVQPEADRGICQLIRCRLGTLVCVFAAGFLLQISVLVSSALSISRRHLNSFLPAAAVIWQWVDYGVSFAVVTAIFALIYKLLPTVKVEWRDVIVGAILTATLFSAGKWGIALYLSRSSFQSVYGAAGSVMVLLVWLYYSSLILLFGAEFTQVWIESRGRSIGRPREAA
jgi:membrane protein